MHKLLILKAFEKSKENLVLLGENDPSKTRIAEEISDYLIDECKVTLSSMRLKQYFNEAVRMKDLDNDINISQRSVVEGLCNLVGYDSFEEFSESETPTKKKSIKFIKKYKYELFVSLLTIVVSIYIIQSNQQKWMTWDNYEYITIEFDEEKFNRGEIEVYSKEKIERFKKIENPNCSTQFFNEKGEEITWYYKRGKNDLEIFTMPGKHPTNGETLKKTTSYMVRTHICAEY